MTGFPNINTVLPVDQFNSLIENYGMRFMWLKSHACPCTYSNIAGQADPACTNCAGYGQYWDNPSAIFQAFITFRHLAPSPDEPGFMMNPKYGPVQHAEPMITVPFTALNGVVWNEASTYDGFLELDSVVRYETTLTVGGIQAVPYQKNLTSLLIAASGAVTTYDVASHSVVTVSGYTVNGANVIMPVGTAPGTPYTVSWHANPIYFVFRKAGGMPHVRPPGAAAAEKLPRAYHVQPLDIWTRARTSPTRSPQGL